MESNIAGNSFSMETLMSRNAQFSFYLIFSFSTTFFPTNNTFHQQVPFGL